MQEPKKITANMTIDLIAPSFGCTTEPYKTRLIEAIKKFKHNGHIIFEGENIFKNDGIVSSNTPENRANEFMKAYKSNSDIIISVGGGELMNEILPFINFEEIKTLPPKWFMGFSDNTNLTFTLTTLCNLVTIYGPNFPSFYPKRNILDNRDALRMIQGEKNFKGYKKYEKESFNKEKNPLCALNLTEPKVITPFNYQKPFTGILLGGCLDVLVNLCGTKYDNVKNFIKDKEIIWFLEACDLNPLQIRRALFELKEAGWFDTSIAFLFGRPLCGDIEIMGVNKYNAVIDILKELNAPILFDIDLGHIAPSMPIKCGAKARVSFKNNNIYFNYK